MLLMIGASKNVKFASIAALKSAPPADSIGIVAGAFRKREYFAQQRHAKMFEWQMNMEGFLIGSRTLRHSANVRRNTGSDFYYRRVKWG